MANEELQLPSADAVMARFGNKQSGEELQLPSADAVAAVFGTNQRDRLPEDLQAQIRMARPTAEQLRASGADQESFSIGKTEFTAEDPVPMFGVAEADTIADSIAMMTSNDPTTLIGIALAAWPNAEFDIASDGEVYVIKDKSDPANAEEPYRGWRRLTNASGFDTRDGMAVGYEVAKEAAIIGTGAALSAFPATSPIGAFVLGANSARLARLASVFSTSALSSAVDIAARKAAGDRSATYWEAIGAGGAATAGYAGIGALGVAGRGIKKLFGGVSMEHQLHKEISDAISAKKASTIDLPVAAFGSPRVKAEYARLAKSTSGTDVFVKDMARVNPELRNIGEKFAFLARQVDAYGRDAADTVAKGAKVMRREADKAFHRTISDAYGKAFKEGKGIKYNTESVIRAIKHKYMSAPEGTEIRANVDKIYTLFHGVSQKAHNRERERLLAMASSAGDKRYANKLRVEAKRHERLMKEAEYHKLKSERNSLADEMEYSPEKLRNDANIEIRRAEVLQHKKEKMQAVRDGMVKAGAEQREIEAIESKIALADEQVTRAIHNSDRLEKLAVVRGDPGYKVEGDVMPQVKHLDNKIEALSIKLESLGYDIKRLEAIDDKITDPIDRLFASMGLSGVDEKIALINNPSSQRLAWDANLSGLTNNTEALHWIASELGSIQAKGGAEAVFVKHMRDIVKDELRTKNRMYKRADDIFEEYNERRVMSDRESFVNNIAKRDGISLSELGDMVDGITDPDRYSAAMDAIKSMDGGGKVVDALIFDRFSRRIAKSVPLDKGGDVSMKNVAGEMHDFFASSRGMERNYNKLTYRGKRTADSLKWITENMRGLPSEVSVKEADRTSSGIKRMLQAMGRIAAIGRAASTADKLVSMSDDKLHELLVNAMTDKNGAKYLNKITAEISTHERLRKLSDQVMEKRRELGLAGSAGHAARLAAQSAISKQTIARTFVDWLGNYVPSRKREHLEELNRVRLFSKYGNFLRSL